MFHIFCKDFRIVWNRIIEVGNGIISLTSWPLIKKLLPKDFFHFTKEIKIDFQQEIELFEQEMESFLQLSGL